MSDPRSRARDFLYRSLTLLAGLSLVVAIPVAAASFPAPRGSGGAVAADERAATEAGLTVLRQGGNAVDAAVATALALAVVHPEAGNLGGGGFAVVRIGGELASLDFREMAPSRAHADMFLDAEGRPKAEASLVGPLAAGVPGSPAGLWELHRRFGRLPWREVVEPSIRLANEGFLVTARLHRSLVAEQSELARFPESAQVWLPSGNPPAIGSRMRLPALARTLSDYAESGPTALMSGAAAEAIERVSEKYGGILEVADLLSYRAVWRRPLRFEAYGWSFAAMDLPTSGGIIVGQTLIQLEALHWSQKPRFGAERAHLLAEALRRSFADRYLLGDPSTTDADSARLLAEAWLGWRRSTVDPGSATRSSEVASLPDDPYGEGDDTTHLSVVDVDGNLVALTTTVNGLFGCKLLVPELGFFLNNEMDDFSTAPGHPNDFGLIQGDANEVAAGKRMLSSMSPTLAWRGSEAVVLGGRGGSKIPTATAQVLLNLLSDDDPLQTAVDRPRLHHQWLPDRLRFEADALSPETRLALEQKGHETEVLSEGGKVNVVRRLADGMVEAAADPRGPGAAGVVNPMP